jgi:hypothetical protein
MLQFWVIRGGILGSNFSEMPKFGFDALNLTQPESPKFQVETLDFLQWALESPLS